MERLDPQAFHVHGPCRHLGPLYVWRCAWGARVRCQQDGTKLCIAVACLSVALCMLRQVGALEYDPELIEQQHHRSFLRDKVVFKEVVPIQDAALRAKIHQTYRLAYLKDVVLPRVLDDATFATFSSLILFNNVEASVSCWVSSAVHWSRCSDALGLILMRSLPWP